MLGNDDGEEDGYGETVGIDTVGNGDGIVGMCVGRCVGEDVGNSVN